MLSVLILVIKRWWWWKLWPFMVVVAVEGNDCRLLMIVELLILTKSDI